jgi:hypothetical protein
VGYYRSWRSELRGGSSVGIGVTYAKHTIGIVMVRRQVNHVLEWRPGADWVQPHSFDVQKKASVSIDSAYGFEYPI